MELKIIAQKNRKQSFSSKFNYCNHCRQRNFGHSRSLFVYFCLVTTAESKQIFYIKICWCLNSNWGPLILEATALQLSHNRCPIVSKVTLLFYNKNLKSLFKNLESKKYCSICSLPTFSQYFVAFVIVNCLPKSCDFKDDDHPCCDAQHRPPKLPS